MLNILYWMMALQKMRRENYLEALSYLDKISTNKLPKKIEVPILKAFCLLFLSQNEYSIITIEEALALLSTPTNRDSVKNFL